MILKTLVSQLTMFDNLYIVKEILLFLNLKDLLVFFTTSKLAHSFDQEDFWKEWFGKNYPHFKISDNFKQTAIKLDKMIFARDFEDRCAAYLNDIYIVDKENSLFKLKDGRSPEIVRTGVDKIGFWNYNLVILFKNGDLVTQSGVLKHIKLFYSDNYMLTAIDKSNRIIYQTLNSVEPTIKETNFNIVKIQKFYLLTDTGLIYRYSYSLEKPILDEIINFSNELFLKTDGTIIDLNKSVYGKNFIYLNNINRGWAFLQETGKLFLANYMVTPLNLWKYCHNIKAIYFGPLIQIILTYDNQLKIRYDDKLSKKLSIAMI